MVSAIKDVKSFACQVMRRKDIPTVDAICATNHHQALDATQETVHLQDGCTEDGENAPQNVDTVDKTDESYALRTIEK